MHVVFGTGPLGRAVMRELRVRGELVRMVNRSGRAEVPPDVEVVAADATERAAARRACAGAAGVYHCDGALRAVAGEIAGDHGRDYGRRRCRRR